MDGMDYKNLLERAYEAIPRRGEYTSRFRMPRIKSSLGRKKTVIENFYEICRTIRRDPKNVAKFYANQLGVPYNLEDKRLMLGSQLSVDRLQRTLEAYIKEYVLCEECGLPDTRLEKEKKITFLVCEACGARRPVRSLKS